MMQLVGVRSLSFLFFCFFNRSFSFNRWISLLGLVLIEGVKKCHRRGIRTQSQIRIEISDLKGLSSEAHLPKRQPENSSHPQLEIGHEPEWQTNDQVEV
jgi:hypothetical protein